ncbi:hypothetical protein [Staphylococcus aureus]
MKQTPYCIKSKNILIIYRTTFALQKNNPAVIGLGGVATLTILCRYDMY